MDPLGPFVLAVRTAVTSGGTAKPTRRSKALMVDVNEPTAAERLEGMGRRTSVNAKKVEIDVNHATALELEAG